MIETGSSRLMQQVLAVKNNLGISRCYKTGSDVLLLYYKCFVAVVVAD